MVHWLRQQQQQQQERTTGRPISQQHEASSSVAYKNKNETFRQETKIKKVGSKKRISLTVRNIWKKKTMDVINEMRIIADVTGFE